MRTMNFEKTIKKIAIALIIIASYTYIHEGTHVRIFEIYDCENIETDYFTYTSANCEDGAKLPTAQHEIIGYTVVPALCVIIFLLLTKKEVEEETQ